MNTILKFFIILMIAITSTACDKQKVDEEKLLEKEKVKLIYAAEAEDTLTIRKIVDEFNESHPDIEVEFLEITGDTGERHDKLITLFSMNSSEYDVFDADVVWVAEFANGRYVLPLNEYIKKDKIDLDNYMKIAINSVTYNEEIWGMPRYITNGMLFYRKDIIVTPPKTWDELIKMAEQYKGEKGTKYGFVFQGKPYEGLVTNVLEYIYAYGGGVLDAHGNVIINSPQSKEGLNKFIEIVKSDYVPKDIDIYREGESADVFLNGGAIFLRHWPYVWQLKNNYRISEKIGIAPLPKGSIKAASTYGGWVSMVNKNTRHPEEAWEFLKFLTGPEGQKIHAMYAALFPTYLPLQSSREILNKNPHFDDPAFLESLKTTVLRPASPVYLQLSDIIQLEVSKVMQGEQSVDKALEVMERKIKSINKDINSVNK